MVVFEPPLEPCEFLSLYVVAIVLNTDELCTWEGIVMADSLGLWVGFNNPL